MNSKTAGHGDAEDAITVVESKRRWLRIDNRPVIFIVGILLILILTGTLLWWHNDSKNVARSKADDQKQAALVAVNQASQLDRTGDYAGEAKVFKNYLATNPPKQYQYKPLVTLGLLAQIRKDYKSALQYYNKAIAINDGNLSEFDAENIALVAGATGDQPKMLVYTKKALQIAEKNPKAYSDIADLKATIKHLEETQ
ncbi:MAG TPA: hypothetical protein VLG47_06365 [Candidatus Saccharimonadales bacterium]|nr:hypothetical protein [Candidatus Saccharimonadales bacterium]